MRLFHLAYAATATTSFSLISPIRRFFSMSDPSNILASEIKSFLESVYRQQQPRNVFSIHVTGGGVQSIAWIFSVPGSSNSVMQAGIPYSRHALTKFQESDSTQCTPETAVRMAKVAAREANECLIAETTSLGVIKDCNVFGIGCTAGQIKKGAHRFYISSYSSNNGCKVYSVNLEKGERNRIGEDYACSRTILHAIGVACGIESSQIGEYLFPSVIGGSSAPTGSDVTAMDQDLLEVIHEINIDEDKDVLDKILTHDCNHAMFVPRDSPTWFVSEGQCTLCQEFAYAEDITLPPGTVVYPGSFNPLHEGHVALAAAALRRLKTTTDTSTGDSDSETLNHPIVFEIAAVNADKPPLAKEELLKRLRQFNPSTNELFKKYGISNAAVSITSKPLFVEKADCFRNCFFVIGADTFSRICDPKYYPNKLRAPCPETSGAEGNVQNMIFALSKIVGNGCKFFVGGRKGKRPGATEDVFLTLTDLYEQQSVIVSEDIKELLFIELSELEFRMDISSTELRHRGRPLEAP